MGATWSATVLVDGHTALPVGSPAYGYVAEARRPVR